MNKDYWIDYYKNNLAVSVPSPFAIYAVKTYLNKTQRILELGCGNGRDTYHIAKYVKEILAVDQSINSGNYENITFEKNDFTTLDVSKIGHFDVVYSRFSMHAIKESEMFSCIKNMSEILNVNGFFLIEARSEKNELYKQGTPHETEENVYLHDGHYRRFLNTAKSLVALESAGFEILYWAEEKDFAPFKGENHHFLRVIAKKAGNRG